jgi:hypothetical protein
MEPENKDGKGEPIKPEVPKQDAFGDNGVAPVPPKEDKKENKNYAPIPDDHPTLVALKTQIDAVKNEMGGNLSGQREIIKGLETKIKELKEGKGGDGKDEEDVLYKPEEIKWSKDLKKEEREEMTDTEIKQMDEIASMKVKQNELFKSQKNSAKGGEDKTTDLQRTVKEEAKELARKADGTIDIELANQIIESSKQFSFEGLDEEKIRERVKSAAKLVSDYKPPKEQTRKDGKPVNGAPAQDDPFGTNKIVEEVAEKKNNGSYGL